jgi:hypothetical protein
MNRYQTYELFPTTVLRVDTQDHFQNQDYHDMIEDIDHMIANNIYIDLEETKPRYQSLPVLFDSAKINGAHWQKLADSFQEACAIYTQTVENLASQQKALQLVSIRGWFYKSFKAVNLVDSKPWHNHIPSWLTGVFYLRIPGDPNREGGTEFTDPRGAGSRTVRDMHILPVEHTWLIFPGWLSHRPNQVDLDEPRYTIAAEIFVKL